jgi:hypothetical protein
MIEVRGQLHVLAALPPVPIGIGDWVGPRAGVDAVAKRKNSIISSAGN